jgi:hypothetical protein
MKDNEILCVAQCCLPNTMIATTTTMDTDDDYFDKHHSNKINKYNIVNDIHAQSLCSLWAGLGHMYKVTIPYPLKQQEIQTTKSTQPRR